MDCISRLNSTNLVEGYGMCYSCTNNNSSCVFFSPQELCLFSCANDSLRSNCNDPAFPSHHFDKNKGIQWNTTALDKCDVTFHGNVTRATEHTTPNSAFPIKTSLAIVMMCLLSLLNA